MIKTDVEHIQEVSNLSVFLWPPDWAGRSPSQNTANADISLSTPNLRDSLFNASTVHRRKCL